MVNKTILDEWFRQLQNWTDPGPLPRLLPTPVETGFAESFDGTHIYWERHGPKPTPNGPRPMVFCYGIVCSMNHWRHQIERLRDKHPCLLVDYRGHHLSEKPEDLRTVNISALARDVIAAIEAQNFGQKAHVWGHSMGVNVALELALAAPALCQSLILTGGTAENPFAHMFHSSLLDKFTAGLLKYFPLFPKAYGNVWKLLLMRPDVTSVFAKLVGGFNGDASPIEDVQNYAESVRRVPPGVFFSLLKDYTKGLSQAVLPKIKTPTLVLAGTKDHVTPSATQKRMAFAMPDAEYCEMPAGSHCLHVDFPDYVALKVDEFWKRRGLV